MLNSGRGFIAAILYILNSLFWPLPVFFMAILRLVPFRPWQRFCHTVMQNSLIYWTSLNNFIQKLTAKIDWRITGLETLRQDDWYLLLSNHICWTDILVLGRVFNKRIPPLKFFMKKELLWMLPVAGVGARLLDFPFMQRYSKSFLAKHPELKGKDFATTRKACEKFKNTPTTIVIFPEGTRFTAEKKQRQDSPYQDLLRPKAGGVAFALSVLGEQFHKILNITIIYPTSSPTLWDYFCGRIKTIKVEIELVPITPDLLGDYENDREFRVYFQNWLNGVWQRKDELICKTKDGLI